MYFIFDMREKLIAVNILLFNRIVFYFLFSVRIVETHPIGCEVISARQFHVMVIAEPILKLTVNFLTCIYCITKP
jgi:hypothetical protein